MINMIVREDMIATAFGLTTLIMAIGGVIGPTALGFMADDLGSYRYPFYVLCGSFAVALYLHGGSCMNSLVLIFFFAMPTAMSCVGVLLCLVVCIMTMLNSSQFAWNEDATYESLDEEEEEADEEAQEDFSDIGILRDDDWAYQDDNGENGEDNNDDEADITADVEQREFKEEDALRERRIPDHSL